MTEQQEKRNKRIGMITSVGIHAAVLIAFLLMMAWRAPNPPYPEYGIELNFGVDDQGFGDVQPETPASESEVTEENPEEEQVEEAADPSEETPVESQEEVTEQPLAKTESPVVVTETKKETKPAEKPEEKPKEVVKKEEPKKEEKLLATFPKSEAAKEEGAAKANQGDDPGKVGDKGSKEGTLDAKALYGKPGGGGGGVGLDLAGWDWDQIPRPQIPGDESDGKIEFEIKVDDNGEIIGYRVLERSLSIDAEKACRDAISKLTFTKKPGAVVPAVSVGKITFVVRTK